MGPKDADGIVNSIDLDHTAPRSNLIWAYTVCLDLSVRKLRNISVGNNYTHLWGGGVCTVFMLAICPSVFQSVRDALVIP